MTRRTATRVLFALALAAGVLAAVLAVIGGFSTRIAGIRLSARGAIRPFLVALFAGSIALRLLPEDERARLVTRAACLGPRLARWAAAIATAVVLAVGIACGTRSAGGSDSYGYVSQSQLWLQGNLHIHQDFAAAAPWPEADWTFSPLGYKPADNHTIVPTYAPGLPVMMAAFSKVAGPCGPFLVTPICAALTVAFAYLLGARLSGPLVGAVAAVLTATSPTFIFMSMWSMSDVPATAFWTAALVVAWRSRGITGAALAGIAAGIAIAIRPNLALLILFPGASLLLAYPARRVSRALMFLAGSVPFVVFVALFNDALYGSPMRSGYGDTASLFTLDNLAVNLTQFSSWLWQTQGPLVFLCVLAPFVPHNRKPALVLLAFVAGVFACYALYTPFHAWWFLRFVLPAFPAIFVLAAHAVWRGLARFDLRLRLVAMLVFTLVCMDWGVRVSKREHVLDLGEGEQKYADVGRFIARELPWDAVVIAIGHSGSVRSYGGRLTLRYDWLDAAWLDRAVAYFRSTGRTTYLVLEAPEIAEFREKFGGQQSVAALDRPAIATHPRGVYLYAIDASAATGAPRVIPRTSGCE